MPDVDDRCDRTARGATRCLRALALLCLVSLPACAPEAGPDRGEGPAVDPAAAASLVGLWEGANENRGRMSFEFHDDGWVDWIARSPEGPVTMRVRYGTEPEGDDLLLELSGFETGPLAGMVMFGRAHVDSEESMRLDLEPAPPGTPNAYPPDLTSADVISLSRVRAPRPSP